MKKSLNPKKGDGPDTKEVTKIWVSKKSHGKADWSVKAESVSIRKGIGHRTGLRITLCQQFSYKCDEPTQPNRVETHRRHRVHS